MINIGQINSLEVVKFAEFGVFWMQENTALPCCLSVSCQKVLKLGSLLTFSCILTLKTNSLPRLKRQSRKSASGA